jgi:hypothetical protein
MQTKHVSGVPEKGLYFWYRKLLCEVEYFLNLFLFLPPKKLFKKIRIYILPYHK